MKPKIYSPIILVLLLAACSEPEKIKHDKNNSTCTFELIERDTCNRIDCNGLKQGNWFIFKNKMHNGNNIVDTVMYKDGVLVK